MLHVGKKKCMQITWEQRTEMDWRGDGAISQKLTFEMSVKGTRQGPSAEKVSVYSRWDEKFT